MRARGLRLTALAVIATAVTGLLVHDSSAAAPGRRPPQTLAQSLALPRGPAAGDAVLTLHHDPAPAKDVDGAAAGVDNGTKRQAPGIPMHRITRAQGLAAASKVLTRSALTAGCALGYGTHGACLPVVSPASARMGGMPMPWTCTEVRALFPSGIALTTPGTDPQALDSNNDGTACDAGD